MKLNFITLMIRDIEKTIELYQKLAHLHIVERFNPGMGEIVFMANEDNETKLEFVQFENVPAVDVSGMTMSFLVTDNLEDIRSLAIKMGYQPSEIIKE